MASNRVGSSSTCFTWGTNSHNTSELKLQIQIHKYNVTTQTHSTNRYLGRKNINAKIQVHIFKHKIKHTKTKMKIEITEFCTNTFMRENTNTYIYTKTLLFEITKLAWSQPHFLCLHSFIKPALGEFFNKKKSGNLLPSNYSFHHYYYFYFYFYYYLHLQVASMLRLTELVTRINAQFLILQINSFLNKRC